MKCVPIDEAVAALQDDLGITDATGSTRFKRWIYEATVGSRLYFLTTGHYTVKLADLKHNKAQLPDDFIGFAQIEFKGTGGCCEPLFDDTICGCKNTSKCCPRYTVTCNEVTNELCFSSNLRECYQELHVKYYTCPLKDGQPIVPENHWNVIQAYVEWKFIGRERRMHAKNTTASRNNPVNQTEVSQARTNYFLLKRSAIAQIVKPKGPARLKHIGEKWLYSSNTFPVSLQKCCERFFRTKYHN